MTKKNNANGLSEFLNKRGNAVQASSETAPKTESADKDRSIVLSSGKKVKLEDLPEIDKQKNNLCGYVLKTGKGYKQHYAWQPKKPKQLPSMFVRPSWITNFVNYSDGLTEKQKEYKKRVVDEAFLHRKTPKVVTSNNEQGLHSYVFWTELYACKNGFFYYTAPLVFSLMLLIINTFRFDFLVNAVFTRLYINTKRCKI